MYYSQLENVKYGEFVAFGDITRVPLPLARSIRTEPAPTPHLQGLIVTRRPLLLAPERYAFVASTIQNLEDNYDGMMERMADCLAQDAPYLEILPPKVKSESRYTFEILHSYTSHLESRLNCGDFDESGEDLPDLSEAAPAHGYDPEIDDEESIVDSGLTFDRKQWIDKLSALVLEYVIANHALPPQEIIDTVISGKLQISPGNRLSPIVVNGNMQIILPAYNELELRMTPLARAVYILFLCHPEGIVLKDMDRHRDQLLEIYLMVKPGADSALAAAYINELTYPGSDSLQQKLSLIKRSINRYLLRPDIAAAYHITGRRGQAYKISGITPDHITIPRAIRR